MKYKEYGMGFSILNNLEHKFKIIDRTKYKKKGRPRKEDYKFMTIQDYIDEAHITMRKRLCEAVFSPKKLYDQTI